MPNEHLPWEEDDQVNDKSLERIWPLDLALAALGGLVIYLIATRLNPSDPRILYNPLTYAAIVPLGVVGLSLLLRGVASRFVRRSTQLGFLLSVAVHLLLMIAAFNWMILSPFWPRATTGVKPERAPLRKTVPDYLFSRTDVPQKQPDWSRPVDAESTSRVMSDPRQEPRPLDAVQPRMEMPREQPQVRTEDRPMVTPRRVPESAPPVPSDSAAALSRREARTLPIPESSIDVPEFPSPQTAAAGAASRETQMERSSALATQGASVPSAATNETTALPQSSTTLASPSPLARASVTPTSPRVGDLAANMAPSSARRREATSAPAGASPTVPSLRAARETDQAFRRLADRGASLELAQGTEGASTAPAQTSQQLQLEGIADSSTPAPLSRARSEAAGVPEVSAGGAELSAMTPSRRVGLDRLPPGAFGSPEVAVPSRAAGGGAEAAASGSQGATDRLVERSQGSEGRGSSRGPADGVASSAIGNPSAATSVDLTAPLGAGGLSADPARRIGFALAEEIPNVSSIDFGPVLPRRRDLGGPIAPAGAEVSGVRAFDRRTMRTAGGAAPTPAGLVGPETEEAIELGLAYLAERQNENGSWSLQGHGEDVLMHSDTAATGLCLLAFQGAGYTHKEHQYADTVARGLRFLTSIQRSNGDLYQRENKVSDQNAWLYSHGIASLALCEAYGMTRDPELRVPAQSAIDFIVQSQDPRSGGWRYVPRQGSDTSVSGWMMMALKSGELAGLTVPPRAYQRIEQWMNLAQEGPNQAARYRYNPLAPDTDTQRHGWNVTETMTSVGLLARLYLGWERTQSEMQQGANYLSTKPPAIGTNRKPQRDTYYWYYATQVMFHMGGDHWRNWNDQLNPILVTGQEKEGPNAGSWDPLRPIPDRWARYAGRVYVTAMNLLSLEVYYRHLPIYEETGK